MSQDIKQSSTYKATVANFSAVDLCERKKASDWESFWAEVDGFNSKTA